MNIYKTLFISLIFQALGTILIIDGHVFISMISSLLILILLIYNYHQKLSLTYSIYLVSLCFIILSSFSYHLGFSQLYASFIFNNLLTSINVIIWLQILVKINFRAFKQLASLINLVNLVFMLFLILTLILDVSYLFYPQILVTSKLMVIGLFVIMFEPLVITYQLIRLYRSWQFFHLKAFNLSHNMVKWSYDKNINKKVY